MTGASSRRIGSFNASVAQRAAQVVWLYTREVCENKTLQNKTSSHWRLNSKSHETTIAPIEIYTPGSDSESIRMSYSDEEITRLESTLKDVLDEHFLESYQQMREKLAQSQQKLNQLLEKVGDCEKELAFYNECDDCKRISKVQHNAEIQTISSDTEQPSANKKLSDTTTSENNKPKEEPNEQIVEQTKQNSNQVTDLAAKRARLGEEPIVITIDDDD